LRVLFLNRSYHPDPEATGQYLTELAEDLVRTGKQVSVICGRSYHVSERWGMLPFRIEERGGVRVIRAFNTQLPKSSFIARLVNLGTYLASCIVALLFAGRPDVVVAETDPPLLPLIGGLYARLVNARFVFVINDLYPDVALELGEVSNVVWVRLLEYATRIGLRWADLVVVLGEDMKRKVLRKGRPPRAITVIRSWVDTDQVKPVKEGNAFRRELGFGADDFVVMYSGNLGLSQSLEDVLRVAGRLRHREDVHFVIIGEGARKGALRSMAGALGLKDSVRFLTYQPKERLGESLSAADLHLIPLAKGVAGSIVPCKVYGIMASGTPYVAIMDRESDVARIAKDHNCGFWCSPDSPNSLKGRIEFACKHRDLLRAMGENGRRAAEAQFSRHQATEAYCRALDGLMGE